MSELKRAERLQIMLTGEELKAVDDWRFDRRMPSRAAAVRELLRRGLAAEGVVVGDRIHSRDFGVMDGPEDRAAQARDRISGNGHDGRAGNGGDGASG